MKLLEIDIKGFGKFHGQHIDFGNKLNIIYGYNETGKSTIHTFIRAMLYGLERARGRASKNDTWSRYEPWDIESPYAGVMKVEYNNEVYRIERNFSKNAANPLIIVNESRGLPVENPKALLDELMCGLTETAYANTVSIGQLKSATEKGMINELKHHISNMNSSGDFSINITKAGELLKAQKKVFTSQIHHEATQDYNANLTEIINIEKEINSPLYINTINSLREEKEKNQQKEAKLLQARAKLMEELSTNHQILEDNGFDDRDEIEEFQSDLNSVYQNFDYAKSKVSKQHFKFIAVLSIILSVLFAALTVYLFISGPENLSSSSSILKHNIFLGVSAVLCLGFLIASEFIIKTFSSQKKLLKTATSELLELFDGMDEDLDEPLPDLEILNENLDALQDISLKISNLEREVESIDEEISQLHSLNERYDSKIELQQKNQWELEKQIEHLSNLRDENTTLKHVISENDRLQTEVSAIDMAYETIQQLSLTIRNSFGMHLNAEASKFIKAITDGVYDSMSVDENLNVFMNTKNKLVPIEQLSSGTMDQIYLALRLASTKLLQGEGEPLPLIFDDSFVNYDEHRLLTTLTWLNKFYDTQILVFTCHKREAFLLHEAETEFNLIQI